MKAGMARLVAASVCAFLIGLAPIVGAAAPPQGHVVVQLLDTSGVPVSGLDVFLHHSSGGYVQATTDARGLADFASVPLAGYFVCWSDPPERFLDLCWGASTPREPAKRFQVSRSATTTVNAIAEVGGRITGRITDAETGVGVSGAVVSVATKVKGLGGDHWDFAATDTTDDSGRYTITGLYTGTYRLEVGGDQYAGTWWPDAVIAEDAQSIDVVAESTRAGYDVAIARAGRLSGHVSRSASNLSDVEVWAYRLSDGSSTALGPFKPAARDDYYTAEGDFAMNVPPGTYRLKFQPTDRGATQWWPNSTDMASATDVVVTSGSEVDGLDAEIAPGDPDRPSNLTLPTFTGNAVVGGTLTADPGVWSPSPDFVTYHWFVNGCGMAGGNPLVVPFSFSGGTISLFVTAHARGYSPAVAPLIPEGTIRGQGGHMCFGPEAAPAGSVTIPGPMFPSIAWWPAPETAAPDAAAALLPSLRGRAKVGHRLRVVGLDSVPTSSRITVAWYTGGKRLAGETNQSIRLAPRFRGRGISARVTVVNPNLGPKTYRTPRVRVR